MPGQKKVYEPLQRLVCTVMRQIGPDEYEVLIKDGNNLAKLVCIVQLHEGEDVFALFGAGAADCYPVLTIDVYPEIRGRPRNSAKKV